MVYYLLWACFQFPATMRTVFLAALVDTVLNHQLNITVISLLVYSRKHSMQVNHSTSSDRESIREGSSLFSVRTALNF